MNVITETVALIVKESESGRPEDASILVGLKRTGPFKKHIMPSGGKLDTVDRGKTKYARLCRCCQRETLQEFGISIFSGARVAILTVTTANSRTVRKVYIYLYTEWDGTPKRKSREFHFIRFRSVASYLKEKRTLPRDSEWLKPVLIDRHMVEVDIHCGKDRTDVLSMRMRRVFK